MRWLVAVVAVAVLAAGSIALAARGGDKENEKPNTGSELATLKCPLEVVDPDAAEPEYRPTKDAFDTAELLDKPLADARSIAQRNGCEVVVSVEDGGGLPVPLDFDPTADLRLHREGHRHRDRRRRRRPVVLSQLAALTASRGSRWAVIGLWLVARGRDGAAAGPAPGGGGRRERHVPGARLGVAGRQAADRREVRPRQRDGGGDRLRARRRAHVRGPADDPGTGA